MLILYLYYSVLVNELSILLTLYFSNYFRLTYRAKQKTMCTARNVEGTPNQAYVRDQYGAKAYDMYRRTGKKFDPSSIDEGLEDH